MAAVAGALVVLLLVALARAWSRWQASRRARRRSARAQRGEADAEELLDELGYHVLGRQVSLTWAIECDGQPHEALLRADLVVERDGRRYVAEVKTGIQAPQLANAATRRQLLEYCVAYRVDSVLLVNVEADEVREVRFPL